MVPRPGQRSDRERQEGSRDHGRVEREAANGHSRDCHPRADNGQYEFDRSPEGSYALEYWCDASDPAEQQSVTRSEERRVGKEGRSGESPDPEEDKVAPTKENVE